MLQSLVGVALQCDAVSSSLDTPSRARDQLVRLRKHVEDFIREARQSIWNLRSPALERHDLAAALRESGERATNGGPVGFDLQVSGAPYRGSRDVDEQLLRIGQEAVLNAVQHSQANRVRVELEYGDRALVLRVSDNGRGFDPGYAGVGPDGHYGLVSMKERAEHIGGQFHLATSPDAGTIVETVVPVPGGYGAS
jgi:signal transduction histidine kinase